MNLLSISTLTDLAIKCQQNNIIISFSYFSSFLTVILVTGIEGITERAFEKEKCLAPTTNRKMTCVLLQYI